MPQLSVFNYSITNKSDDSVDVFIDGYIVDSPTLEIIKEWWGDETSVSYKSFRDSIPEGIKTLNLFVNSGGGHVGDAMAIHDYLEDLEGRGVIVSRQGRGIVASAATYLVMGNNSSLSENCLFMIHNVSGFAYGDVNQIENQAKALRKFNDLIVNFYATKTGLSNTVIGNMMDKETWLDAKEAKDKGFVKSVGNKVTISNSIKAENWPFQNMAMLNTYNSFITNDNTMDTKKITDAIQNGFNSLLEKLGLKDKSEDETVKNAFSGFSEAIVNALKEVAPSDESIQTLVNDAVANALKDLGNNESIKNAITEALKNTATKDDIKNIITKEDLTTAITNLTNNIADKLGNKSKPDEGEDKSKNNSRKNRIKNRFSNVEFWDN